MALFRDIDPLIKASKRGLPATEEFLDDLRPVLAELDPTLRQLNPILSYLALYQEEITAFFSNTVASTQAVTSDGVHYLRTTNPVIENLAVYNQRLGSNRPNPYVKPGAFRKLRDGLLVYEDRHCGRGPVPVLGPVAGIANLLGGETIAQQLIATINGTGSGTTAPAPPCKKQGPFTLNGRTGTFPQVTASGGAVARSVPK